MQFKRQFSKDSNKLDQSIIKKNNQVNKQELIIQLSDDDDEDQKNQIINQRSQDQLKSQKDKYTNPIEVEQDIFQLFIWQQPRDKTRLFFIIQADKFNRDVMQLNQKISCPIFTTQNGSQWIISFQKQENKANNVQIIVQYLATNVLKRCNFIINFKIQYYNSNNEFKDKQVQSTKYINLEVDDKDEMAMQVELKQKIGKFYLEIQISLLKTQGYNSKLFTNYVGLINQGNTCYINSLLQTYFHLKEFVRLIFNYPLKNKSEKSNKQEDNLPIALQDLFFQLETNNREQSTEQLLKSFGWEKQQAWVQQDVHEFNCFFLNVLEKKINQNMETHGKLSQLFQGEIKNRIECQDFQHISEQIEQFYDIQLNVKDCKDIIASLQDINRDEILEGDNIYETGTEKGKSRARKKIFFQTLPKVLFFHLKRFEYNAEKDANIKIMDQFKYYNTINLFDFMHDKKKHKSKNCEYQLFAVLVHCGELSQGGHYYVYIKPKPKDDVWYKFNDEMVTLSNQYQVFDLNYGGKFPFKRFDKEKQQVVEDSLTVSSTAYMLVYIKIIEAENILREIKMNEYPEWLQDKRKYEIEQKKQQELYKNMIEISFISFELLKKQACLTTGLFYHKIAQSLIIDGQYNINNQFQTQLLYKKYFNISLSFQDFYQEVADMLNVQINDFTLWKITFASNQKEKFQNSCKFFKLGQNFNIEQIYRGQIQLEQQRNPVFLVLPICKNINLQFFTQIEKQIELNYQKTNSNDGKKSLTKQSINKESISQKDDYTNLFNNIVNDEYMLIIVKNYQYSNFNSSIRIFQYDYYPKQQNFKPFIDQFMKNHNQYYKFSNNTLFIQNDDKITRLDMDQYDISAEVLFQYQQIGFLIIQLETKESSQPYVSFQNFIDSINNKVEITIEDNSEDVKHKLLLNINSSYRDIINTIDSQILNDRDINKEKIFIKAKLQSRKPFEEIPYPQNPNLPILKDLISWEKLIQFDISNNLLTKEREFKFEVQFAYFSNKTGELKPKQQFVIEKNATVNIFLQILKEEKLIDKYLQEDGIKSNAFLKACFIENENPNRINNYLTNTQKVFYDIQKQFIRVECSERETTKDDVTIICSQIIRQNNEYFGHPFSFIINQDDLFYKLKKTLIDIMQNKNIQYEGKQIQFDENFIEIFVLSDYSHYSTDRKLISTLLHFSINLLIQQKQKKTLYLEIAYNNIYSSYNKQAIKMDI